jgi:hypothetical protein
MLGNSWKCMLRRTAAFFRKLGGYMHAYEDGNRRRVGGVDLGNIDDCRFYTPHKACRLLRHRCHPEFEDLSSSGGNRVREVSSISSIKSSIQIKTIFLTGFALLALMRSISTPHLHGLPLATTSASQSQSKVNINKLTSTPFSHAVNI